MIEFTPFQQDIRDRFYKYTHLIPPELAVIEEKFDKDNSLWLELEPKDNTKSHLYITVENNGATLIQLASNASFERFHPSIKGGGQEDAEYVERLIRAVMYGRVEETAVLRKGEIIRSHIRVFSETGKQVAEQYWSNELGIFSFFFRNTEENEIVYKPYLSPGDCQSIV